VVISEASLISKHEIMNLTTQRELAGKGRKKNKKNNFCRRKRQPRKTRRGGKGTIGEVLKEKKGFTATRRVTKTGVNKAM